jgi:predicted urease superfamily metal-dependent hydrolase
MKGDTQLQGSAASADLQARTREVTTEVTERAADVADNVTAAITKEAQAQGLTADSLRQSARDVGQKVQNVVSQSAERLRSGTSA